MNICVAGCGVASQSLHIPAWRKIKCVTIPAAVDVNQNIEKEARQKIEAKVYQRIEGLPLKEVNAVDICTPTLARFSLAKTALSKGVNIIAEKPICVASTVGQMLFDIANKQRLKIGVIQHFIHLKAVMWAKRLLDSGCLRNDVIINVFSYFKRGS